MSVLVVKHFPLFHFPLGSLTVGGMGFIPERLLMMMMMGIRNYHVGILIYISKSCLLAVSGQSLESCKNNATLA